MKTEFDKTENEALNKTNVSGCTGFLKENIMECKHEYKTNYCNSDGSYSHTVCDDCNETIEL